MLHIAICDDEPAQLHYLQTVVAKALADRPVRIAAYADGHDLIDAVEEGTAFDIAILDIELQMGVSGIEIAHRLNQKSPRTQIIYSSAHIGYAPELYATEHVYFMLKPIQPDKLQDALAKATAKAAQLANDVLFVQIRGKSIGLPHTGIVYCESSQRLVRIHCTDGIVEVYARLDELEEKLGDGKFLRCHKSYLVNMAKIQQFESKGILLQGGTELPVSAQRYAAAKKAFFRFIGEL